MSLIGNNIIYNGDFDAFSIEENTYVYYSDLTAEQQNNFCWNLAGFASLFNGSTYIFYPEPPDEIYNGNSVTFFDFPDPSGVVQNSNQYIALQDTATVIQSINITQTGNYQLTFFYTGSDQQIFNEIMIFFAGSLKTTLTVKPSTWTTYTISFDVLTTGAQDLLFQGQAGKNGIAIANVDFRLITIINNNPNPVSPAPVVNNLINNGKFALPTLAVNTSTKMNRGGFITGWTYTANTAQIVLCNGVVNEFIAPTSASQYVYLLSKNSISQTINITQVGTYNFSM